jgi:2-dehydro-3-deoxyphosphogluconate aldolase / (4S)-4-hydroxy-2-oxoglutarate aldolase
MNKDALAQRIREIGIIPVVRADSPEQALLAVDAVMQGGIPIVEITMTVPGAMEIIRNLARSRANRILLGAGTVLDAETARQCLDAGAEFIVSPGLDPATIASVSRQGGLMMAGALSPTEVITAWRLGSDFVKIFPCGQVGGAQYIKALRGPLPQIPLVPTGGVNLLTAPELIAAGAAALGVGGELVQPAALKQNQPELIVEAARKFREAVALARNPQSAASARSK